MTAASSGSTAAGTPAAGPRPQLLTIAAILLGVSAVLALLFPISQLTDDTFYGCQVAVASANATPTASSSATPSPKPSSTATTTAQQQAQFKDCVKGQGDIAPSGDVSGDAGRLLLQGAIPFVILAGLAFFAFRGVPLVRWFVVGAWVLGGIIGIVPLGPLQAVGVIQQDFPTVTIVVVVLGSLAFTAAAVLVNFPLVVRYFNARRPIRVAATRGGAAGRPAGGQGGLFGSLFGPKPPRGGTPSRPTSSSTNAPVSMEKSTVTRPPKSKGGGSGNTGRAKGKKRG